MLRKVSILNFQSLRRLKLDLGHLTVITGASDVGKSAIVRAIRAALDNQRGSNFVTHGEAKAAVELAFDDGTLAWIKPREGGAEYRLKVGDGAVETFAKMGAGIPFVIEKFLGMGEVAVGDAALQPNVASQFATTFLLNESGAMRARLLGRVTGVDTLTLANQEARRREQAAKRSRDEKVRQRDELRERLRGYGGLTEQKNALNNLGQVLEVCDQSFDACERLADDLRELAEAEETVVTLREKVASVPDVESLDTQRLQDLWREYLELKAALSDLQRHEESVAGYQRAAVQRQEVLDTILRRLVEVDVCPTCGSPVTVEALLEHAHA